MKIFYKKQKVEIGDFIRYEEMEVPVTQDLINNNPKLFEIIDNKQELLEEAKHKFPVGTKFRNMDNGVTQTVLNDTHIYVDSEIYCGLTPKSEWQPYGNSNPTIYENGKWAKRYLFTSEDRIDIFEDDKIVPVAIDNEHGYKKYTFINQSWSATKHTIHNGFVYFSSEETAEKYLKSLKEKTLEDYENILLNNKCSAKMWYLDNDISKPLILLSKGKFYETLRNNEPKLYWTKVLKLIADDLNGDWKPDWADETQGKWSVRKFGNKYNLEVLCLHDSGQIFFKSNKATEKAIKIMGDTLDFIFN